MLRESFESLCVYPFITKKLRRLSTKAEYIRKFVEACEIPKIICCSPVFSLGFFNMTFVFLDNQLSSSVIHVVMLFTVPSTLQMSSSNVTPRCRPTLQRGFLLTVSTPCMRIYQRQDHTQHLVRVKVVTIF